MPREAEWEYGCRGGTTTKFYFGDSEEDLGDYAWYTKNTNNKGTQPCGLKRPNAFGLYDMHGLALEWCADGQRTYRDQEETDPEGPTDAAAGRVLKAGSWLTTPRDCRAALRVPARPLWVRGDRVGFRVLASR
jgi:formylglycine-generating enzyme required for sulfatase activity